MKTIEDVLNKAAEGLKAEGARTLPHREWTRPQQRPAGGPGVAVAVLAAVLTITILGGPALFTSTDAGPRTDEVGQSEPSTIDNEAEPSLDAPTVPEKARLLVKTDVPGLGQFSLFIQPDAETVEVDGPPVEMTCIHLVPGTLLGSPDGSPQVRDISLCGESMAATSFGIYPTETCSEATGTGIAIISVLGLPADSSTVHLTFNDGSQEIVTGDNNAAIWAWVTAKSLIKLEIPGVASEQVEAAVQLPIGTCN